MHLPLYPAGALVSVLVSVLVSALALTSPVALAESDINYTYLEAAYVDTEIDDIDGDGFALEGSFAISDSVFVIAGYGNLDLDFGADADQWSAGIGAHTSLSDRTDLVGSVRYVDAEVDTFFGSFSDDGYGLNVGLRSHVTDVVELEGGINYIDLDASGDETTLEIAGHYFFAPEFSVGLGVEMGSDLTAWHLGARVKF